MEIESVKKLLSKYFNIYNDLEINSNWKFFSYLQPNLNFSAKVKGFFMDEFTDYVIIDIFRANGLICESDSYMDVNHFLKVYKRIE